VPTLFRGSYVYETVCLARAPLPAPGRARAGENFT